jgi:hypothetical protein
MENEVVLETQESLRDTLTASFDSQVADDAPVVETSEAKAERQRDEAGRFAPKGAELAAVVDPAAKTTIAAPPAATEVLSPAVAKNAPSAWKKELAEKEWQTLPDSIKDEILRREGDFHKGIEGFKSHADMGRTFEKAVAPYMDTIRKFGVTPDVAVSELLRVDNLLRTAPPAVKMQEFMKIARDYGIDLNQQFAPETAQYQQQLYETQQRLQEIERQNKEQSSSAVASEIERFKSAPGHEHFDAVRDDMAALLQGGRASDMDKAYEMACYANPEVRQSLLEQERRRLANENTAKRALTAAVSVKGSSPASGKSAAPHGSSLRADLEAAFESNS